MARRLARLNAWRAEVRTYWRECVRPRDFVSLMRVRLSQSKVGRWVTPEPITVRVDLNTLGPSVTLRSHTTDISVLKELLVGDSYEPLPADLEVETVVDLGAAPLSLGQRPFALPVHDEATDENGRPDRHGVECDVDVGARDGASGFRASQRGDSRSDARAVRLEF